MDPSPFSDLQENYGDICGPELDDGQLGTGAAENDHGRECGEVRTCTVKISGLAREVTKDTIINYMENQRHSGGDEVKESRFDRDSGTAYITFHSPKVAERVAKKQHRLDERDLKVSLYRCLPPDERKIVVSGLNPVTTRDGIIHYFGAKTEYEVAGVQYRSEEDRSTALIAFTEDVDFQKVKVACDGKSLDESYLKVSPVHISNCISVENLCENTTKDCIKYYFENAGKSGGGEVEEVEMSEDGGSCFVYFLDPLVAEHVSSKKHHLDDNPLKVRIYQKCFDTVCKSQWKTPKPFIFTVDSQHKLNFLKSSDIHLKALNEQMNMGHAKLEFHPDSNVSTVEVQCTLTLQTKDGKKLSKNWKDNAEELLKKYIDLIKQAEVKVLTDVWKQLKDKLKSFEQNKNQVNIIFDDDNTSAIVTGSEPGFSNVERKVKEISDAIVDEMNRINQEITEKMDLPEYKLKLLIAKEFPNWLKMKFKDLKVTMDLKQHTISFCGNPNEVKDAQIELYKILNDCKQHTLEFPDSKLQLMDYKQIKVHIEDQFKAHSIIAAWNIIQGNLVIYGLSDKTLMDAVRMIKTTLVEQEIPLSDESSKLLSSVKWQQLNESLLNKFNGQYFLRWSNNAVTITAIKAVIEVIAEDITNFFQDNTIYSHVFPLVYGYYQFLKCFKKNAIVDIVEKQKHNSVTVDYGGNKITIQGTETGLKVVLSELSELRERIVFKAECFFRPCIGSFLESPEGKNILKLIEQENKCVILKSASKVMSFQHQSCMLSVIKGDITTLKVDAFVNAENEEFKHSDGDAKVIIDDGGHVIQDECIKLKNNGLIKLSTGQVLSIQNEKFPCSFIFKAVGPCWNGRYTDEEKYLEKAINNCMEMAEKMNLKSIAFPVISTGLYGYPSAMAAVVIIKTIKTYLDNNQNSCVQQVIAADMRDNIITDFVNAFSQCFEVERRQPQLSFKKMSSGAAAQNPTANSGQRPIYIKIISGEIARVKADVLVNTTVPKLTLNVGGVSSSLLTAAGPGIQQECSQKYPNGIQQGIAITKGYNLPCEEVYHCSLPQWNSSTGVQTILDIVEKCLDEANSNGHTSVVFPALGTGTLKYPSDIVAQTMHDAVNKYAMKKKNTTVSKVIFAIYHKDSAILKEFMLYQTDGVKSAGAAAQNPTANSGQRPIYIKIISGEIARVKADVLVNTTVPKLTLNVGGVSSSLLTAAGPGIQQECSQKYPNGIQQGIAITKGYNLPCEEVYHCSLPQWKSSTGVQTILDIVEKCLDEANSNGHTSVVFPALGTGTLKYPSDIVAQTMHDAVNKYAMKKKNTTVSKVIFAIYHKDSAILKEFMLYQTDGVKSAGAAAQNPTANSGQRPIYIKIISGEIARVKADVLVNTTVPKLTLNVGGVSSSLLTAAGPGIQQECSQKYPNGIQQGIAITKGYNLPCEEVYHCSLPQWKSSTGVQTILDIVEKCLDEANSNGHTSVVFPALGTGTLKYPSDIVAQTMHDAVNKYAMKKKNTTVSKVIFAIYHKDSAILKEFMLYQTDGVKSAGAAAQNPTANSGQRPIYIKIISGEIARVKADVLVNTTVPKLTLNVGGVSSSLLTAAGPGIQQECSQKYPNGIQQGIAITKGYNLPCEEVYHCSLPQWKSSTGVQTILDIVEKCLDEANSNGHTSVVFPALGTGTLKYPSDIVAQTMHDAVNKYAMKKKNTTVSKVIFAIYHKDSAILKEFHTYQQTKRNTSRVSRKSKQHADRMYYDESSDSSVLKDMPLKIGSINFSIVENFVNQTKIDCIVKRTLQDSDVKALAGTRVMVKRSEGTPWKYIIYANTKAFTLDDYFKTCFQTAENECMSSLAFDSDAFAFSEESLKTLVSALTDFEKKSNNLKDVRLITYKEQISSNLQSKICCKQEPSNFSIKKIFSYLKKYAHSVFPFGKAKDVSVAPKSSNSYTLVFYSDSMKNIDATIGNINRNYEQEFHSDSIKDKQIKSLSESEVCKIKGLECIYALNITIKKSIGEIQIEVFKKDHSNVMKSIHEILNCSSRNAHEQSEAQLMKQLVQWYYYGIDENSAGKIIVYPDLINYRIETAYQNSEKKFSFETDTGTFIIDFEKLEEYSERDPSDSTQVVRKDLKAMLVELPSTWDDPVDLYRSVKLKAGSSEYQAVKQNFTHSLKNTTTTIKSIERIQNPNLYQLYATKKKQFEKKNQNVVENEKTVWHGTDLEAVTNINMHGFNRSYCGKNATFYGDGVYFAAQSSYSLDKKYSTPDINGYRYIYQCKVLVGEVATGMAHMKSPPKKSDDDLYDSLVDKPGCPALYVIFNDAQCYPEYLITFT